MFQIYVNALKLFLKFDERTQKNSARTHAGKILCCALGSYKNLHKEIFVQIFKNEVQNENS